VDAQRRAVIIWTALCLAVAGFFAVTFFVRVPPRQDVLRPLLGIAAAMTVVCLVASRVLPERIKRPGGASREQFAMQRHIIACALCEGAALFACVVLLITRSSIAGAIAAVGYAALLLSYPGLERWQRLLGPEDARES
jgi:hypothetical protein